MTRYLLDTNILLRLSDSASPDQSRMFNAVAQILAQKDECCITAQVLIELWVVATRPLNVNGLGWTIERKQRPRSQTFRFNLPYSLKQKQSIQPGATS